MQSDETRFEQHTVRRGRWGRSRLLTIPAMVLAMATLGAVGVDTWDVASAGATSGPSGVVTIGEDLTGFSSEPVTFDITKSHVGAVQDPWDMAIYDTLLRPTPGNGYLPELATKATIVNPEEITLQLRKGVVFSDGTPFTAQAVAAGILRNKNANAPAFDATLQDVSSIGVTGPLSLTIQFSQPVAGAFYPLLASEETFIASPKAVAVGNLATNPVGAGPFVLKQYISAQKIVLARNPRYWDAKDIKIKELDYANVQVGPQQVNALESGTVNVTSIQATDAPAVRENPAYVVASGAAQTQSLWMPVCKSTSPLDNVKVRQALNDGVDRTGINHAVLQGLGQPQWAIVPKGNLYFDPALNGYYAYNPKKAKQLLAQAGYSKGLPLSVIVTTSNPVMAETATILQAQWKKIGVELTIVPSTNFVSDLYLRKLAPLGLNPEVRGGLEGLTGPYSLSGGTGDICDYNDPTLNAITSQIGELAPQSPKAIALWRQAQTYIVKNALSVWIDFSPFIYASAKNVHGVSFMLQYALPVPYFWTLSVGPS